MWRWTWHCFVLVFYILGKASDKSCKSAHVRHIAEEFGVVVPKSSKFVNFGYTDGKISVKDDDRNHAITLDYIRASCGSEEVRTYYSWAQGLLPTGWRCLQQFFLALNFSENIYWLWTIRTIISGLHWKWFWKKSVVTRRCTKYIGLCVHAFGTVKMTSLVTRQQQCF